MLKLCEDIDTLAMMMLDGELASQEQRDVELHILDCEACKAHLERERAAMTTRRQLLAPPPAPMLLRARVARALDDADRAARPSARRFVLPGAAALAAVAALALFAVGLPGRASSTSGGISTRTPPHTPVPLQQAATGPIDRSIVSSMEYQRSGREVVGRNAVLLHYAVGVPNREMYDVQVNCFDAEGAQLGPRGRQMVGAYEVWIGAGNVMVRDGDLMMILASKTLSADALVQLVGGTPLVAKVRGDVGR